VDSRHETLDDTVFVVEDFCERSETVGGARRIRDLARVIRSTTLGSESNLRRRTWCRRRQG
jgi:hypothetical protein